VLPPVCPPMDPPTEPACAVVPAGRTPPVAVVVPVAPATAPAPPERPPVAVPPLLPATALLPAAAPPDELLPPAPAPPRAVLVAPAPPLSVTPPELPAPPPEGVVPLEPASPEVPVVPALDCPPLFEDPQAASSSAAIQREPPMDRVSCLMPTTVWERQGLLRIMSSTALRRNPGVMGATPVAAIHREHHPGKSPTILPNRFVSRQRTFPLRLAVAGGLPLLG
jgi:hypothetical protein